MSDAAGMLARFNSHWFVVLFGIAIAYSTVHFRYFQIAKTLKWLALFLFAYVITAFVIQPDWRAVLHDTFVPSWPKGQRCVAESCGDPRDHNQSLPVFLAGFRGSGGREGDGSPHAAAARRGDQTGNQRSKTRCRSRHIFL